MALLECTVFLLRQLLRLSVKISFSLAAIVKNFFMNASAPQGFLWSGVAYSLPGNSARWWRFFVLSFLTIQHLNLYSRKKRLFCGWLLKVLSLMTGCHTELYRFSTKCCVECILTNEVFYFNTLIATQRCFYVFFWFKHFSEGYWLDSVHYVLIWS